MLVILSPAKKLDWTARPDATTQPDFQADAVALADIARDLGAPGLKKADAYQRQAGRAES